MELIENWLTEFGVHHKMATFCISCLEIVVIASGALLAYLIFKHFLMKGIKKVINRVGTNWHDILFEKHFFHFTSHFAPALFIYITAPYISGKSELVLSVIRCGAQIYKLLVGMLAMNSFLNSVVAVYGTFEMFRKMPIKSFMQVIKIFMYFFIAIMVLSILIGKSPAFFLGGLGAMAAIMMLVFKDSILGLVSGIQLSTNKMVQINDWIEMPKFDANGDVIDISLTSVKVRNWDKTITTIPTYALVSNSFKNWRGMSESGGRRIKRAVYIDITSIKFCTEEMLKKFKKFQYITEYVESKKKEIAEYNSELNMDDSELVNGRRLTNIGTFRAYVIAFLRNHPKIHQQMTFLVRHLQPGQYGLPIEIYVFSNDQVWANYEAIQADIFDHIFSVIPEFQLRVFQNPSGADFQKLQHSQRA